ncbi:MAG: glycosyltransferase family 4 protein [Thiotrichaceae bacterium]|nr:glycosyltransferase family 4 protein [Thiotrichaceae bacterium]PCI12188.1 MAG: glycosyl transferase family 1 [Thiotrichales bacterium]
MRVINVGQNYHIRGGSDKYQFSLESLLQQYGHDVIPFASRQAANVDTTWSGYFPPEVSFQCPGPIDILRYIYSRPAGQSMRRLVQEQSPDIAHLHIYYGQLTPAILSPLKKAGVPIVQTLHEYKTVCPTYNLYAHGAICDACQGRQFWQAVVRRCNRGSFLRSTLSATEAYVSRWLGGVDKIDHFIAVSDFLREKVIALGLPRDKVTTVHNFMDCTGIKPATSQGSYLLYFGRLERLKGIFTLLDAVAPLCDIPVLIVGDGNDRMAVEAVIEKRGLEHVKLLGFKRGQELVDLIQGSICTIAPSEWYETFGLNLVESFASGRPVVASRIGGMTEVVADGEDGFLVSPGDVDALRERLLWMVTHPGQALEMGLSGRAKVEDQFSPERHYEKLMAVYKKVGVQ